MDSQLNRKVSGAKTEEFSFSSFSNDGGRAITNILAVFPLKYSRGRVLLFTDMPITGCCCCCGDEANASGDLVGILIKRSLPTTILMKGTMTSATRTMSTGASFMSTSETNLFPCSSDPAFVRSTISSDVNSERYDFEVRSNSRHFFSTLLHSARVNTNEKHVW